MADVRLMLEVAKQNKKNESLKEELMIYMTQGLNLSYEEAKYYYRKLRTDNSLFVEFTSFVRNGEYSPLMISVEGHNAKSLAEEKGLNPLQAYNMLLDLKNDKNALEKSENLMKEVTSEDKTEETSGKEKSFFGKLFKK